MQANNDTLSPRQQKLIAIAAFTAKGDTENLKTAFNEALDSGLTVNEVNEELAHLYAYCGFAASVRGTNVFKDVVQQRQAQGSVTPQGRKATPLQSNDSKYRRGEAAQVIVTGMTVSQLNEAFSFNPVLDVFLKEHLFADIFGSDLLSYTDRELITVSALTSMQEPLAKPHFGGALNVGISQAQLRELLSIIENKIGAREAAIGQQILEEVLKGRNNA